jgi:hypothetical protein
VLLDWTDKDALAAERDSVTAQSVKTAPKAAAAVEVITRDLTGLYAA